MADKKKLTYEISGDSKDLQKDLKKTQGVIGKISAKLSKVGQKTGAIFKQAGQIAAVGIGAITGAITGAVAAYKTQEQAEIRTRQTIAATGKAAGLSAEEIFKMASSLQEVTTFGDEAIINGQNLLLTFRNIGGETFPRATEAMLDMSTAMGTDLKSSAIQLGKALNDPTAGLSALSRTGITFTEQQKDQIKTMQKAGDIAGAQAVILEELENQFGGVARAAAGGTGILTQVSNAAGDIAEMFGKAAMPAITALGGELLQLVSDGQKSQDMFTTFRDIVQGFSIGLLNLKRVVQVVGTAIGAVLGTAVGAVMQTMEGNFSQAFETIKGSAEQFKNDMLDIEKGYQESRKRLDDEFSKSEAERQNTAQMEERAQKKAHFQQMIKEEEELRAQKNQKELDDKIAQMDEMTLLNEEELEKELARQEEEKEREELKKIEELEAKGMHDEALVALDTLKTKKLIENSKKKIAQDKLEADEKKKQWSTLLNGTASFMNSAGQMARKGSMEQKALMTGSAIISTYTAANQAYASPPGPPWTIPLAASIVLMGMQNVAKINSTKLANGGVYMGGIPGVDSIPATVQRGEITAPVKSYDEVIEGAIQQRGYVKEDEAGGNSVNVHLTMNENFMEFF